MCDQAHTILVLEDDRAISTLLCLILRRKGYTVLTASNGSDAAQLGQLHRKKLDLVLADVVLRNECGISAVARLRESSPEARVIFLSGFTLERLFQEGLLDPALMSDGSAFFLQKPFLPELLIRAVESVLDRQRVTKMEDWRSEEVAYARGAY